MKNNIKNKTAFILLAFAACIPAAAFNATVLSVQGTAEVQDGSIWEEIVQGDELEEGSVISTGFKSSLVLKIKESTVTVGQLARVTIEELSESQASDNVCVYIDSGNIDASVGKESGKKVGFKIRSPVATASVRGTSFSVTSSGKLSVTDGLVGFLPAESKGSKAFSENIVQKEAKEDNPVSSVFTSSSEAGGSYGVPVFRGQSSSTDPLTGRRSSARTEKAKSAEKSSSSTKPQSQTEAVPSSTGSARPDTTSAPSLSGTAAISIKLNFPEK